MMADDTKTFEFDPLPGDTPVPPAAPVERPKRGPKKGAKRGPRKVAPIPYSPAPVQAMESLNTELLTWQHEDYAVVRAFSNLSEYGRQRVLGLLRKVFA